MEQGRPSGRSFKDRTSFPRSFCRCTRSCRPAHSSLAKFVPPGRNLPSRCSIGRDPRIMQGLWIETQSPDVQTRPSLHTGANSEDFRRSPVSATLASRVIGYSGACQKRASRRSMAISSADFWPSPVLITFVSLLVCLAHTPGEKSAHT
jgi:hypothetical protein